VTIRDTDVAPWGGSGAIGADGREGGADLKVAGSREQGTAWTMSIGSLF
jgi:hypothetical protein